MNKGVTKMRFYKTFSKNFARKIFRLELILFLTFMMSAGIAEAQGAGKALNLGNHGERKYVDCGNDESLQMSNGFTVEAWIKPIDLASENWQRIVTKGDWISGPTNYGWLFHLSDYVNGKTSLLIDMEINNGTTTQTYTAGTDYLISEEKWYHCAATYDGTDIKLFVNGIQRATLNAPGTMAENHSVEPNGYNLRIGSSYDLQYFYGYVDDVRIWNVALDVNTLRTWMNKTVTTSHPQWSHLKGYWRFEDESNPTTDYSDENNNGTLTSYYDDTYPTFITSTAPIGDNSAFVNTTSQTAVGPEGGQIKVTITSTPDDNNNLMVYQFGETDGEPVLTGETFPADFDRRSNIVWGIKEIGDVTATLTFDYSNVYGVSDPSKIEILRRDDASDTTWEEMIETSRDDNARTITISGVSSFSQFAIGGGKDGENPLPIILSSFCANFTNENVSLIWVTASENNTLGWNIYRGEKEDALESNETIKINNSLIESHASESVSQEYRFIDYYPLNQNSIYWYWLENISESGESEYFGPVMLKIPGNGENPDNPFNATNYGLSQNYPNPFGSSTVISLIMPSQVKNIEKISIYNVKGQKVKTLNYVNQSISSSSNFTTYSFVWNGKDANGNPAESGIYFYKLETVNGTQFKKMLLKK